MSNDNGVGRRKVFIGTGEREHAKNIDNQLIYWPAVSSWDLNNIH